MFARTIKIAAIAALGFATVIPAAAEARHYRGDGYGGGYYQGGRGYRGGGGYYGHRGGYGYGGRGYYRGRCRDRGTGGTIIGAIAGGLLGHEVAQGRYNRGDGTAGAIVGAGVGALAGPRDRSRLLRGAPDGSRCHFASSNSDASCSTIVPPSCSASMIVTARA